MRLLKDTCYELYEKACDRCGKCPFYYYERGWEDVDECCEIKGWSWDEGLCINMFLPLWLLKIKYKMYQDKQDRKYARYEKKMIKKANKCPKKCEECCWEECGFIHHNNFC